MDKQYSDSPLLSLNTEQWEALCDGCGKCCLVKLQDEDTDEIAYTNVHCEYLDNDCRCSVYKNRREKKPGCLILTKNNLSILEWLPNSCAYKRVHEGKAPLPGHQVKIRFPIINENDICESELVEHIVDDAQLR